MSVELANLYTRKEGDEFIRWVEDPRYIGFSVIRNYPENCGFIPAVNKEGIPDTKVLIKVGYTTAKIVDGKVNLFISTSKFSKYLSDHFRYNFEDSESPTKASIDTSEKSLQPVDLDDSGRYIIDLEVGNVFDSEENKTININQLVEILYETHLRTIKGVSAVILKTKIKTKVFFQLSFIHFFERVSKFFVKANKTFLGKSLPQKKDFLEGLFKPYEYGSLVTLDPQAIPFFKSTVQISKLCVFWVAFTMLMLWKVDALKEMNETFSVSMIVVLIYYYDTIAPYGVLFLANQAIKITAWAANLNIRTKFK